MVFEGHSMHLFYPNALHNYAAFSSGINKQVICACIDVDFYTTISKSVKTGMEAKYQWQWKWHASCVLNICLSLDDRVTGRWR